MSGSRSAIAKAVPPPRGSIALNNIAELRELAEMLYRGGLCPPGIDNPNKCAAVILAGLEVGLAPTQALGTIMLTNGRLSIYGDGAMALVRASGLLESIEEWVDGEGDERTGHCKAKRRGESERHYTFSMREAIQAGLIERARGKDGKARGPWISYPDRMLVARPRGFLFRDVFPDVLRGLITYEESQDMTNGDGGGTSRVDPSIVHTEVRVTGVTNATGQLTPAEQVAATATPSDPVATAATATPSDPVATAATATAATATAATTAPPLTGDPAVSAQLSGPITLAQKEELFKLHAFVMASYGISAQDKPAQRAAWEQTLAPYGVTSINQMDAATAARAITEIGQVHDPFGYPRTAHSSEKPAA